MVRSSAGRSFEKRKHDGYAFVVGSFTYSIVGMLAMWPLGWAIPSDYRRFEMQEKLHNT